MIKHIIPQLLPIAFASIAIAVPAAILGEAALSFLGLGDPSIPTWGRILHDANSAGAIARGIWWWTMIPGFMIALTGIAFILIGNALNSILNLKSRVRIQ
jgi:peptide/nickel transport system permease protein